MFNNPPQNEIKEFQKAEDPRMKADYLEIPQNGISCLFRFCLLSPIIKVGKKKNHIMSSNPP